MSFVVFLSSALPHDEQRAKLSKFTKFNLLVLSPACEKFGFSCYNLRVLILDKFKVTIAVLKCISYTISDFPPYSIVSR